MGKLDGTTEHHWPMRVLLLLAAIPILLLVAAFVLAALFFYVIYSILLHVLIWVWWCMRRRDVLLVYSDSPVWKERIEERVLSVLRHRAIVLNWSNRRRWRLSLATLAFHHFGGHREFNPLAVVFRPFRPTRTFRFWRPFRDFKHGNTRPLEEMETSLLESVGCPGEPRQ